jgi:BlaI family penicillinase repressor
VSKAVFRVVLPLRRGLFLFGATVRTQLRILEEKGVVKHRTAGKRFLYSALVPRKSAAKAALRTVVDVFFGGSVEDALATHLSDPKAKLDAEQLQRLRDLIDQHSSKGP